MILQADSESRRDGATMIVCPECGEEWEAESRLAGLSRNYLCPKCEVSCAARKVAEEEALRREHLEAAWKLMCPSGYRKTDPVRLVRENPLAAEPLAKVLAWQYGPKGLLAIGPTRGGKTRSLFLLIRRLLEEGRDIRAFDCADFGHDCQLRFMDGSGVNWVRSLAEAEICFFDDFGKMPLTERVEGELAALIERRTAHERPILATTNMTGARLEDKASQDRGAPMVRRLREFCQVVVFAYEPPGGDRRRNQGG